MVLATTADNVNFVVLFAGDFFNFNDRLSIATSETAVNAVQQFALSFGNFLISFSAVIKPTRAEIASVKEPTTVLGMLSLPKIFVGIPSFSISSKSQSCDLALTSCVVVALVYFVFLSLEILTEKQLKQQN